MKVIQLNVERDRHLERWVPFLKQEAPDVVCLQEVMEPTLERVAQELSMHATHEPMARLHGYEPGTENVPWGIALLSNQPHTVEAVHHYRTNGRWDTLPTFDKETWRGRYHDAPTHRLLLVARAGAVRLAVTHFTWTPNGRPNDVQRNDMDALRHVLDQYDRLVLCGDMNIPRKENELYGVLHEHLVDNIPSDVESTLDPVLHRVPSLRYVVDYVSSTPHYAVRNVRVVDRLSDHKAIVADVERV